MPGIRSVHLAPFDLTRLTPIVGDDRVAALVEIARVARWELEGVTVWNVNSTESGGGVAEMLRSLVGYTVGFGIDGRWTVVEGDEAFFDITKRIHNQLHGHVGGGALGAQDAGHYRTVTDELGQALAAQVKPGDVVLLHDPQTAGMSARLAAAGAHVIWRCHVGTDTSNEWTEAAWTFLEPHLEQCQAFIFSRRQYAPAWLPSAAVVVIPPSIDPFSPKNEDLDPPDVAAILRDAGLLGSSNPRAKKYRRPGKTGAAIVRKARFLGAPGPLDPDVPLVVQVSRWDRLKDMPGVMRGFAAGAIGPTDAHLAVVGPAASTIADDPEEAGVLAECVACWEVLDAPARERVSIVTLPMDDVEENALIVNAVQRHAAVVAQKSLVEGFGLTVAEAMWKARPVVASAVGGIVDQVAPGTGVLLEDPTDLEAFGAAVATLLKDPEAAAALGAAARRRVQQEFVGDQHLIAYARLMSELHLRPK